jgi:hypothetical protein
VLDLAHDCIDNYVNQSAILAEVRREGHSTALAPLFRQPFGKSFPNNVCRIRAVQAGSTR